MEPKISIVNIKEFGKCVKLYLKEKLYSLHDIYAAGYIFLDRAYIILDKEEEEIIAYLFPKKKNDDLRKLGMEFLDELINYAHYSSRAAQNAETSKAILQKALFSASPSLVQEAEDKEAKRLVKELSQKKQAKKK